MVHDQPKTFEVELAFSITQNGEPFYANVSTYEGLPIEGVLEIEEKLYHTLGELLDMAKEVVFDDNDNNKIENTDTVEKVNEDVQETWGPTVR